MKHSTAPFRVRYGETDQMGIAYHANYLVWCEMGRTDLMRELGLPYGQIEEEGTFLAVVEARVRYGAAAHYEDLIRVDTWVEDVRSRAITFAYEVHRVDPDPGRLARATTTLVSMDRSGRTRTLPDSLRKRFQP